MWLLLTGKLLDFVNHPSDNTPDLNLIVLTEFNVLIGRVIRCKILVAPSNRVLWETGSR